MNQKVLKTIEYTKIIAMLIEEAESSLGKERAEALLPSSDFYEVERNLLETEEADSAKGADLLSGDYGYTPLFSETATRGFSFRIRTVPSGKNARKQ